MKTASVWGHPPNRFYNFLREVQRLNQPPCDYTLGVLGCADGKFVLPAARRGLSVLAIDQDRIALFGGKKPGVDSDTEIEGLVGRVKTEKLSHKVTIVHGDFTSLPPKRCLAVWTSGAIQYSFNIPKTADLILSRITAYVIPGGLLYIDYMLPYEKKYQGRPNCPDAAWWKEHLYSLSGWTIIYNKVLPPTLDRAHIEYPIDHYHQWGHVLMKRSL